MVKNLPAMKETRVQSLGQEDPLEEGMATHSALTGEFHGQRSLAGLQFKGLQRVGYDWVTDTFILSWYTYWVGENEV